MELNDKTIQNLALTKGSHIHFIGIGGSSMSGLAEFALNHGYIISGSDNSISDATKKLQKLGITVFLGHNENNITDALSLVVYTNAVGESNPELVKARALNIPTVERGIFLGFIAGHYNSAIAVSGVHGKTTTTSMLAAILTKCNKNPSVHLGGVIPWANSNIILGGNDIFLTEACEYHNNFLHISPDVAILTNLEPEHLDFFGTFENMKKSFSEFASKVSKDGTLIVCGDSLEAIDCCKNASAKKITYSLVSKESPKISGFESAHHYFAEILTSAENPIPSIEQDGNNNVAIEGFSFKLFKDGNFVDTFALHVPGKHNVLNALAAIAAAETLGCQLEDIKQGFELFHGTKRRFEYVGSYNGASIISDYAHHPTELAATIAAAKQVAKGRVLAVFQPHTYSRIISLRDQFPSAVKEADEIIVTDIYAAREIDTGKISSQMLSDDFSRAGLNSKYIGPFADVAAYIKTVVREGDIVLLLGAGTIDKLADFIK